jgi:hypothetical protein
LQAQPVHTSCDSPYPPPNNRGAGFSTPGVFLYGAGALHLPLWQRREVRYWIGLDGGARIVKHKGLFGKTRIDTGEGYGTIPSWVLST